MAKQIANLSSKLSSEFKALRTKTSSTEESIKLILQQLDEIKSQVCMTEQSLLAHMQDNVSSSPILNCLGKLKNRWPDARIRLSGLTYVPRVEAKNTLINEINCFHESICSKLDLIYIDNKRVTCDMYGNLNDQVFYDDVHLNNRIGTRKLVTNIKHHLGLRGRNFESRPTSLDVRRNRREIRVQAGPQTFNHRASNRISQPLQALNLHAEYLRESELSLTR